MSVNTTIEAFGHPESLLHEGQHWVVLLRPQQVTLGSLVLAHRGPETAFSEISAAAFAEFGELVGSIERLLKAEVNYEKINYLMLMMVDPHVHFHVIPRYEGVRSWSEIDFPDAGWPGPPALGAYAQLDSNVRKALISRLRAAW
jgi:diadenosine tetraphosphate (Ap4A) HIT family hydrolase